MYPKQTFAKSPKNRCITKALSRFSFPKYTISFLRRPNSSGFEHLLNKFILILPKIENYFKKIFRKVGRHLRSISVEHYA